MKRKVLRLLLCGLLACSMLTACGGSDNSAKSRVESDVEVSKDDSSNQEKTSDTILDVVKYHNDIDDESDYSMMETAKSYLKDKGITYQDDDDELVSTLSDDFLGYRAYYYWDGDDYVIDITFDSEDELKQAVSDVKEYLSGKIDKDYEGSELNKWVDDKFQNKEVYCTSYELNGDKVACNLVEIKVNGNLSAFRTENESEYMLGDCESFIELYVFGGDVSVDTKSNEMGEQEAAPAAEGE